MTLATTFPGEASSNSEEMHLRTSTAVCRRYDLFCEGADDPAVGAHFATAAYRVRIRHRIAHRMVAPASPVIVARQADNPAGVRIAPDAIERRAGFGAGRRKKSIQPAQ